LPSCSLAIHSRWSSTSNFASGRVAGYGPIFAAEFDNDGRLRAVRSSPRRDRPRKPTRPAPCAAVHAVAASSIDRDVRISRSRLHPSWARRASRRRLQGAGQRAVVAVMARVVVRAGANGASGRMVRTANRFETEYRTFGDCRPRRRARRPGELIGRVGAPGLVTDDLIRVKRNGVFINPLTGRALAPAEPVPAAEMGAFQRVRDRQFSALTTTPRYAHE
jgi:hypothetical protein